MTNSSNKKEGISTCKLSDRGKCLFTIYAILLGEILSHKTSFIPVYCTIELSFDIVKPFITNYKLSKANSTRCQVRFLRKA